MKLADGGPDNADLVRLHVLPHGARVPLVNSPRPASTGSTPAPGRAANGQDDPGRLRRQVEATGDLMWMVRCSLVVWGLAGLVSCAPSMRWGGGRQAAGPPPRYADVPFVEVEPVEAPP